MRITILAVGKLKEKYLSDAVSEYTKRLSRFCSIEIIEIKDERIPENASQKELLSVLDKEGDAILARLPKNSFKIAMCIEGRQVASTEFSEIIDKIKLESSEIVFIIGGSLGLSERVKSACDMRISFGKITLPHQLMRVVLPEQIYRAFKISSGESYHK